MDAYRPLSVAAVALLLMCAGPLAAQAEQAVPGVANPPSGRGAGSMCFCSDGTTVVLLDQAPNQVRISVSDAPFAVSQAESFTMPADATISEIRIWAVYYSGNTPLDPDNFTVIFHDDADDLPGANTAPPESGLAAACRETTGVTIEILGIVVDEYVYRLELTSPVTFPNFGRYWLEIFNDTTGNQGNAFHWESGVEDPIFGFFNHAYAEQTPGVDWQPAEGLLGGSLAVQLCAIFPDIFTDGFENGDTSAWQ